MSSKTRGASRGETNMRIPITSVELSGGNNVSVGMLSGGAYPKIFPTNCEPGGKLNCLSYIALSHDATRFGLKFAKSFLAAALDCTIRTNDCEMVLPSEDAITG